MNTRPLYAKNGIHAHVTSFDGTDVCEYSAAGVVDAPMEVVAEVLFDIDSYSQWMADVAESRLIEEIDRHRKIVYCRMGLPWPVTDRDFVVANDAVIDRERARVTITFSAVNDPRVPAAKKPVRMTELSGRFVLDTLGRDRTLLRFAQKAHPGGSMPAKVANVNSQHYPFRGIEGIRKMAGKAVYHDRAAASPERELLWTVLADQEGVRAVFAARLAECLADEELARAAVSAVSRTDMPDTYPDFATVRDTLARVMDRLTEDGLVPDRDPAPLTRDPALTRTILQS